MLCNLLQRDEESHTLASSIRNGLHAQHADLQLTTVEKYHPSSRTFHHFIDSFILASKALGRSISSDIVFVAL